MIICIKMGTSREIQVCISIGTFYFILFSIKWGVCACLTEYWWPSINWTRLTIPGGSEGPGAHCFIAFSSSPWDLLVLCHFCSTDIIPKAELHAFGDWPQWNSFRFQGMFSIDRKQLASILYLFAHYRKQNVLILRKHRITEITLFINQFVPVKNKTIKHKLRNLCTTFLY